MSTNRMHRSNRLLRTIMAMLLIVTMTVQQGAYVLADETVPQAVTEASTPQTQAASEKNTEPAAPAAQPETAAPETKAPETAAPEKKAPETTAPETKAAETAAPETAAPETKTPETKTPETAAPKSETKVSETASTEKVRENAVSFAAAEGAKVYVDGKDVTNQKGTARDGKIIFKVVPETGYAIASVKVDDTKDARNTHNENEYIIEGIQTDNTVVRVTMNKVETEDHGETEINAETESSGITVSGETELNESESDGITESFPENNINKVYRVIRRVPAFNGSFDLASLLDSVTINNAQKDENNNYVFKEGTTYGISLSFSEKGESGQLPKDGKLTYILPDGVNDLAIIKGQLTVNNDTEYTQILIPYTISGKTITFDLDSLTDDKKEELFGLTNVKFYLSFNASFDSQKSELKFSDSIDYHYTINKKHEVTVSKTWYWDNNAKKARGELRVKSDGNNSNVVITDSFAEGSVLKYNQDAVLKHPDNTILNYHATSSTDNGFAYTIPSMTDGEEIIISYTASIDETKLNPATDKGKIIDSSQTTNKVIVNSDGGKQNEESKSLYEINYSSLSKSAGQVGEGGLITWTINANTEQLASIGGTTIKDTIKDDGSRSILSYAGDGITVKVTDEWGNNTTRKVLWRDLDMTGSGDFDWVYNIPNTDGRYAYEITYQTRADVSGLSVDKTVKNVAEGVPGTSEGSAIVSPGEGNKIAFEKTHTKVNLGAGSKYVTYQLSFNLPKGKAYNKVVVYDELQSSGGYKDTFDANSINVTVDKKSYTNYELRTDGIDSNRTFELEFFKDTAKKEAGMAQSDVNRTIVVTYNVNLSQEWLDAVKNNSNLAEHKNTAHLIVNDDSLDDYDTVKIVPTSVKKSGKEVGKTALNDGTQVPYYRYEVLLQNISPDQDGNVYLDDSFNTNLLELYDGEKDSRYVVGGNIWTQWATGTEQEGYKETTNGVRFTIKNLPKDENGNLFDAYKFVYYLRVKGAKEYKELINRANENRGTYSINNVASTGGSEGKCSINFTYKPLSKTLVNENQVTSGNSRYATYTISFNPAAAELNNGKNITITDKLSTNQQFLSEDFQFIPENAKVSSSVSEDKKTATFVVNDNAAVTITYSTIITAENDNEEINNTVTALGKSEEVKKNVVVSHTSGGSGSRTQIILQKKEEGNNDVNLSGAVFELYKEDDTPVTYTTGYNSGKKVTVTTTSNRGTVTIGASGCGYDLYEGTSYYLKEITAPKGYSLSDKKWGFRIESDFTKVDITKGKYPMGDRDHIPTMTVTDKPLSVSGEARFSAEKVLNGAALKEGEFEFALKDSSGKTLSTANYEASYTQADVGKTYTYTINEVIPAADKQEADMEYDTTEYTVEVTPTDNGSGKLTCTPVYKKGDTETQTATFTNTKTTKGGAVLQITKALKGRMLKDSDRFEFELKDAAGTVLQTKTNVGGTVTFDEIPYSKEDVAKSPFIYTIHESSDKSAEGITNGKDVTACQQCHQCICGIYQRCNNNKYV